MPIKLNTHACKLTAHVWLHNYPSWLIYFVVNKNEPVWYTLYILQQIINNMCAPEDHRVCISCAFILQIGPWASKCIYWSYFYIKDVDNFRFFPPIMNEVVWVEQLSEDMQTWWMYMSPKPESSVHCPLNGLEICYWLLTLVWRIIEM